MMLGKISERPWFLKSTSETGICRISEILEENRSDRAQHDASANKNAVFMRTF